MAHTVVLDTSLRKTWLTVLMIPPLMVHLTLVMNNTKSILYGQGNTIPDDLRLERALDALQSVHNIGSNMYS